MLDENNKTITLWSYIGSDETVTVYSKYNINGVEYQTKIASNDNDKNANFDSFYMFRLHAPIKSVTFNKGIDTTDTLSMAAMFHSVTIETLDIKNLNTSHTKDFSMMFCGFKSLDDVLDLSTFDTSYAEDFSYMFQDCSHKSILMTNFDTSKVTNFFSMFSHCPNIGKLNLTTFDTSNVKVDSYSGHISGAACMFSNSPLLTEVKVSSKLWTIDAKITPMIFEDSGISSLTYV